MPDGTQVALRRLSVSVDGGHCAAVDPSVVSFPKPVWRSKDIAAGLPETVVGPLGGAVLDLPASDVLSLKRPAVDRRPLSKASPRFRCPHCRGRDSLGLEQRQATACLVQRHRCADCLQAIPRHLAERWLGLSFEEARSQWRGLRRLAAGKGTAVEKPTGKPFQPDSFALLRLLRREAARNRLGADKA